MLATNLAAESLRISLKGIKMAKSDRAKQFTSSGLCIYLYHRHARSVHTCTDIYRHAQSVFADAYVMKEMIPGCSVIDCKVSAGKKIDGVMLTFFIGILKRWALG